MLWILLSDTLVAMTVEDKSLATQISVIKGWGFILATSILLFVLITRLLARLEQSKRTLAESEKRYRTLAENFPQGSVGLFDQNLRYIIVDGQGLRDPGWALSARAKATIHQILPLDAVSQVEPIFRQALQGRTATGTITVQGKRYETVAIPIKDDSGVVYAGMAVTRDVTELAQSQEQTARRTKELEVLSRSIQSVNSVLETEAIISSLTESAMTMVDATAGMIGYHKDGMMIFPSYRKDGEARSVGLEFGVKDGLIGRVMRNLEPVVGDVKEDSAVFQKIKGRLQFQNFVVVPILSRRRELIGCFWLQDKNGGIPFDSMDVSMLEGLAAGAAVAFENAQIISSLKAAQEGLKQNAEQLSLRVQERTAELNEINQELESFAYSASHDLRAPLRAMQGFAQALQEDYAPDLDDTAKDYVRRIVDSSVRMDVLVQDLLEYSRISRAQISCEDLDLEAEVDYVLGSLEQEIRSTGATVSVARPMLRAKGHARTLEQVLQNLVTNALKFQPSGQRPEIVLRSERQGGMVRLWVEDNGIGIAPEHHERVFRIFERLHGVEKYPGTGIGLAIVKKGVARMNGEVGVVSESGKGSGFWIELPAGEGKS